MFNDHLSGEEIKERIKQRLQEAEDHKLYKQIGYNDLGISRWALAIIALVVVLVWLF